jgi:hypothetical protein
MRRLLQFFLLRILCGDVQDKQIQGLHTYNVDANIHYRKHFGLDLTLVTEKRGLNE